MNTGPHEDKLYGGTTTRKNSPERGIRGVHVGVPRGTAGWLVYVPSTGQICQKVSRNTRYRSVLFSQNCESQINLI